MATRFPFLDQVEEQRKQDRRRLAVRGFYGTAFDQRGNRGPLGALNRMAAAWGAKRVGEAIDKDAAEKSATRRKALADAVQRGMRARGPVTNRAPEEARVDSIDEAGNDPTTYAAPTKADRVSAALGGMLETGENIELAPSIAALVGAMHRDPVEHKVKRGERIYRDGELYLEGAPEKPDTSVVTIDGVQWLVNDATGARIAKLGREYAGGDVGSDGKPLTTAQRTTNEEVKQARDIVEHLARTRFKEHDDPYREMYRQAFRTDPYTGSLVDRDPDLAHRLRTARNRLYGRDEGFRRWSRRLAGLPPMNVPAPPAPGTPTRTGGPGEAAAATRPATAFDVGGKYAPGGRSMSADDLAAAVAASRGAPAVAGPVSPGGARSGEGRGVMADTGPTAVPHAQGGPARSVADLIAAIQAMSAAEGDPRNVPGPLPAGPHDRFRTTAEGAMPPADMAPPSAPLPPPGPPVAVGPTVEGEGPGMARGPGSPAPPAPIPATPPPLEALQTEADVRAYLAGVQNGTIPRRPGDREKLIAIIKRIRAAQQ